MTKAPTDENSIDRSYGEGDDLTVINDIGPARQQWLRESFGVRTYRDLAILSADEVESRLKAEGQIAARAKIEQWIAQARKLAAAVDLASQQVVEAEELEAAEEAIPPARLGEWRSFAAFVVEFQARELEDREKEHQLEVTHIPVDERGTWLENDRHKEVVKGERLYQWMLDQLGERVWGEPEAEEKPPVEVRPAVALPATVPQVNMEITQVRAYQPPQAETANAIGEASRPFPGFLRSGVPFALEALFKLTGPAARDFAKAQITHHAEFRVADLSTGAATYLGDTGPDTLVESRRVHPARLREATLPSGMYRLQVLATLESEPPVLGFLTVPLLQVV